MQTVAGLMCVLLGAVHFVDRDRPHQAVRTYYLGALVQTPRTRAALALLEVGIGFALLFTS